MLVLSMSKYLYLGLVGREPAVAPIIDLSFTVTKAGVETRKIFVGESSYGRSFKMAQAGCKGPMCTFTGTKNVSYAKPGECTGMSHCEA